MLRLFFDENLSGEIAAAFRLMELDAVAVGDEGVPPRKSKDETNCEWCSKHNAVLITTDRGKKDKEICTAIAKHRVHVIFVHDDLRDGEAYLLVRALLNSIEKMSQVAEKHLLHHRLRIKGGLEKR